MARPRKTVAELKLTGMYGKRSSHKDYNEVVPEQIIDPLNAPTSYLQRTRDAWDAMMSVKMKQRVLSHEDLASIKLMFDSLDMYFRVTDRMFEIFKNTDITEREPLTTLKDLTMMRKTYLENWIRICAQFGMTPTERTKLQTHEQEETTPLAQLVKKAQEA